MTRAEIERIALHWSTPPRRRDPLPARDARADIQALLAELARMQANWEAEVESHRLTMEGLPAW